MGFKLLRPQPTNICVKTTDLSPNTSSSTSPSGISPNSNNSSNSNDDEDVFETTTRASEDLIKFPKTSPTIYTKIHSIHNQQEQEEEAEELDQQQNNYGHSRRHSIITLLQPVHSIPLQEPNNVKKIQLVKNRRTNSENTLLKSSSTFTTAASQNITSSSSSTTTAIEKSNISHQLNTTSSHQQNPKPILVEPEPKEEKAYTKSHNNNSNQTLLMRTESNQSGLNIQRESIDKSEMPTSSEANILKKSKIPIKSKVAMKIPAAAAAATQVSTSPRHTTTKKTTPTTTAAIQSPTRCFGGRSNSTSRSLIDKEEDKQSNYNIFGSLKNMKNLIHPKNETKKGQQQQQRLVGSANSICTTNTSTLRYGNPLINHHHQQLSITPDNTKLLLISNPSITITTEEEELEDTSLENDAYYQEEEPLIIKNPNNRKSITDLNQILGNFKKITTASTSTTTTTIKTFQPAPSGTGTNIKGPYDQQSFVTEFGIIDTSRCVDFGIYDFLSENQDRSLHYSSGDEIEIDMSSDTDTSFGLEATPPNRFSDSDMELCSIEPLAITSDSSLFVRTTISSSISSGEIEMNNITTSNLRKSDFDGKNHDDEIYGSLISDTFHRQQQEETNKNNNNFKKPLLRRNISLPAAIFKLRLIGIGKTISAYDTATANISSTTAANNIAATIARRKLYNSSNSSSNSRILSRLDSTSLTELEKLQHSNSIDSNSSTISNLSLLLLSGRSTSFTGHNLSSYSGESNSSIMMMATTANGQNTNNSQFEGEFEEINEENETVFTNELEKNALILRKTKRMLSRQDTLGNFAPPDFCNT